MFEENLRTQAFQMDSILDNKSASNTLTVRQSPVKIFLIKVRHCPDSILIFGYFAYGRIP